jgi:hypothetical protein
MDPEFSLHYSQEQEIESRYYPNMIKNRQIIFLARYVDDIIISFDTTHTSAELILKDNNDMHQQLKYKLEIEKYQRINFLDLCINRKTDEFTIGIYRKPTFTDRSIRVASNHSSSYKQGTFNFLLDRAHNLPITYEEREKEIKSMNLKGYGRKRSWPNSRYESGIF